MRLLDRFRGVPLTRAERSRLILMIDYEIEDCQAELAVLRDPMQRRSVSEYMKYIESIRLKLAR